VRQNERTHHQPTTGGPRILSSHTRSTPAHSHRCGRASPFTVTRAVDRQFHPPTVRVPSSASTTRFLRRHCGHPPTPWVRARMAARRMTIASCRISRKTCSSSNANSYPVVAGHDTMQARCAQDARRIAATRAADTGMTACSRIRSRVSCHPCATFVPRLPPPRYFPSPVAALSAHPRSPFAPCR
jgi:hypothetical protein